MPQTLLDPPPGFDELTTEEKVEYVQSLWDRILAGPDDVPVPRWHQEVVGERLDAHRADPDAARPWEETREDLARKLKDRRSRQE
jgi:putative addiction module component (TIGR02574 family)